MCSPRVLARPSRPTPTRALALLLLGSVAACGGVEVELSEDPPPETGAASDGAEAQPVTGEGEDEASEGEAPGSLPIMGSTIPADHCLAGITDLDKAGPFTFKKRSVGLVRMWVPNVPAGCKVPMVHLSNGTGGWCGVYEPSLEHLASHGFLALCFESPVTGSGDFGMIAFQTALKEYPELADLRFGSTGHSQGGYGALITLQYAEQRWGSKGVYAGLAMQPASGFGAQPLTNLWPVIYAKIKSPVFMFSGVGTDGLVVEPWVWAAYLLLSPKVEAYDWAKLLSLHIPVPNHEEKQISIPWFRWKLLGDKKACEAFKAIPKHDKSWRVRAEKNVQPCY